MTLLAVMALFPVTRGADKGVPISGWYMACLTGQVTSPSSLSSGAARSEPHRTSWPTAGTAGRGVAVDGGPAGAGGCTRGAWVQGQHRVRAPHRDGRVHIRAVTRARLGRGRGKNGAGTVPERCQNSVNNGHNPTHPAPTHPTPDTRYPVPTTSKVPRV